MHYEAVFTWPWMKTLIFAHEQVYRRRPWTKTFTFLDSRFRFDVPFSDVIFQLKFVNSCFCFFRLKIRERFSKKNLIWRWSKLPILRLNWRAAMCFSPAKSSSSACPISPMKLERGRWRMLFRNFLAFR